MPEPLEIQRHVEGERGAESPKKKRKKAKVFDESVTEEQRRALRQKQRGLQATLQSSELRNGADEGNTLELCHEELNAHFDEVQYPREAVLDANNFQELANINCKKIEKNAQVTRYDPHKFVAALASKCTRSHAFDWLGLGVEAGVCFNAVPSGCAFGAGRWDDPTAAKKERKKKRSMVAEEAKLQRPDEVKATSDAPKSSSVAEQNVKRIKKRLERLSDAMLEQEDGDSKEENHQGAIDGIDFLIDTQSFTKTVENMFYFSFLVKSGDASMIMTEPSALGEQPRFLVKPTDLKNANADAAQCITSLSMRDWRRLCALKKRRQAAA